MFLENLGQWLLDQGGVVVVLGTVIFFLYREWIKEREVNRRMAKDVIKLTTLWEAKGEELNDETHKTAVIALLKEIKLLIKTK